MPGIPAISLVASSVLPDDESAIRRRRELLRGHLALVVAGLRIGVRWLARAGLVGTLSAAALLAIGSFAFVAVAAASAALALGAALLPRSGRFRRAMNP